MTTLFISDLHLDASRPDITGAFERFMTQIAPSADALYILGDFFEAWIGDDDRNDFNQHIVNLLKRYTDSGKSLFLMVGNRDFLLGEEFARQCGATLLDDPTRIDLYGTATLLMHGDSLCTKDEEYMAFRLQARSTQWQQQLLAQPIEARRALARQLREQSKSMTSLKAEDIMDVTASEVLREMEDHRVTRMIHGHTHRPDRHSIKLTGSEGERIVLGDWHDHLWWLEAEPSGSLQQHKRPIDQPNLLVSTS
ncbi:UDP-2,3-diacylglucosamine diphosphatase [Aestuariicella hydrocarbonica]|uniref:UDP-2,3-diacylglucosamine hydrolase n=1 Tax=Pseudomaricurvus hydrocarbonicus TaxID=1470433 RepID=A0A9E5JV26_9GAMM|nr:UDP-2,3-diacylglucosamine diphosphatase [Aestuariicella hydrocarbonica]NHO65425.1 UDP-2,3-diacylglucosamine diphosphatase [Aestuariicella hydrocarbonica]